MTPTENTAPRMWLPAWAMVWQLDTTEGRQHGPWVTAGKYGRTAGKRGASGYEPAGKSNPIATGLKAA